MLISITLVLNNKQKRPQKRHALGATNLSGPSIARNFLPVTTMRGFALLFFILVMSCFLLNKALRIGLQRRTIGLQRRNMGAEWQESKNGSFEISGGDLTSAVLKAAKACQCDATGNDNHLKGLKVSMVEVLGLSIKECLAKHGYKGDPYETKHGFWKVNAAKRTITWDQWKICPPHDYVASLHYLIESVLKPAGLTVNGRKLYDSHNCDPYDTGLVDVKDNYLRHVNVGEMINGGVQRGPLSDLEDILLEEFNNEPAYKGGAKQQRLVYNEHEKQLQEDWNRDGKFSRASMGCADY